MTDQASNAAAQNDTVADQTSGDTSVNQDQTGSSQTDAEKLYGQGNPGQEGDQAANAKPDDDQNGGAQNQGENQEGDQTDGEQGDQQNEIQDFTMPEGMALDEELSGELKAFAQENNLTQEQAQTVADMGVKMLQKQQAAFETLRTQWADAAKTDNEIGGEKFNENLASANKALSHFASEDLVSYLQESGLGNHPEMIRAWYKVSQAMSEETFLTDGGNAGNKENLSQAERLYPDMK